MRPKISIVMPTWNRGSMIQNAILSIQNQTLKDWELIIVDDGSDDNTWFVVKQFQDDKRIRYFPKKHEGLVVARNFGVSEAQADVIAHQDSDDLSMPNRLERMLPLLWSGTTSVVYSALYENAWNNKFGAISRRFIPALVLDKDRLLIEQYLPGVCLFKKKVWEAKPFRIETQYAFDWMMYLDWAYSGYGFKALNEGLYEYVRTQDSASILFEREGKRAESVAKIKEIMEKEYHA